MKKQNLRQIISFTIVGVINTAVDVGIFTFLIHFDAPMLLAVIVSTTIGLGCSFALNQKHVFKSDNPSKLTIIYFLVVTLVGLWIIQPLIITGVSTLLSSNSLISVITGKLMATGVTAVWNFCWYRYGVFRPSNQISKFTTE